MAGGNPIGYLTEASKVESFEHFKEHMEQSMLFRNKDKNREYAIKRAIGNEVADGLYVELGVAGGDGCRLFGNMLKPHGLEMTGFDSFEGLEEDWTGMQSGREVGAFTQAGELPKVPDNVTLVKGWVQDTLPGYLEDTGKAPFAFVHMDMDTYTPTAYAMAAIKSRLRKGTVILFDELYGYPGWKHHEYKALQETLNEADYRYICFSTESVAIEMLRKPK
ncbi:class I SAM-dependent methyltransferase [Gymnodinialimonas sp.]